MDDEANAFASDADDQEFARLVTEGMVSVINAATASKQFMKYETQALMIGTVMPVKEQRLRYANAVNLWCGAKAAVATLHLFIAERMPNSVLEHYAIKQSQMCDNMLSLAQGKVTADECMPSRTLN